MNEVRVIALNIYPVKGCRRIELTEAVVATAGLAASGAGDREWMVVDAQARFITQREFPKLALIRVTATGDALCLAASSASCTMAIPLVRKRSAAREVLVWNSHVRGFDEGDAAAAWLTDYLGVGARLVRFDRTLPRPCNPPFAGDSGAHALFSDGYPFLVIGEASLADLNSRLTARGSAALPMDRFRPNIVLDGLDPYAEDHVDTIETGGIVLRLVKPCTRCQVTTTDQDSTAVGVEPLRTLGEYRMDHGLGGVTFGMNAVLIEGEGRTLSCGATARVSYRF